ncbi:MAG: hypothetical protein EBZ36_07375, partial [Acidobacteria bacterium]|nr:hypothetical protein [Acidobacteriota bacterium]
MTASIVGQAADRITLTESNLATISNGDVVYALVDHYVSALGSVLGLYRSAAGAGDRSARSFILGGLRKAVEGTDINLPTGVRVTRFRVWLLEPYAQRVNYSGFTASLNGQSLATSKRSGSGTEGRYLDIDLTRRADLAMSGAKNVVEVQAREEARDGEGGAVVYRTSFVILIGGPPGRAVGVERPAISCQSIPAVVDP